MTKLTVLMVPENFSTICEVVLSYAVNNLTNKQTERVIYFAEKVTIDFTTSTIVPRSYTRETDS